MTTSGITSYNLTASQIIALALKKLTIIGPGETVAQEDYDTCLDILNLMIKKWQAPTFGLHIWLETECTLYLNPGQTYYKIGSLSSDRVAQSDSSVITTVNASQNIGDTIITLTSVTGINVNDNIGISQDDGSIVWTTVSSINTGLLQVTINSALTQTASVGDTVYTYTSLAGRMRDIFNVRLLRSGNVSLLMYPLSKSDYFRIPNLTLKSTPVQYFTDRKIDHSRLYFYGTSQTAADCVQFTGTRVIQDFVLSTNNPDLPQEWLAPVIDNLAIEVSTVYGKEYKASQGLKSIAQMSLDALQSYDQEDAPLFFHPDMMGYDD
jgi:hypothetical protein